MAVPAPVVELDEPYAALGETPRQQAVVGERLGSRLRSVEFVDLLRLPAEVEGLRGLDLHAEGQLVLSDPCQGFRIANLLRSLPVEFLQRLQGALAEMPRDPRRVGHEQHRVSLRTTLHPLVDRRQEAGAPD